MNKKGDNMFRHVCWALVPAILSGPLSAQTGDKKADGPKEILKVEGKLTADDPFDKKFPKCHRKEHTVKLEAGQKVRIDLTSSAFDSYLRIEDKSGKVLEENDDFYPGTTNSCIIFHANKAGPFKLIVTSFGTDGPKIGPYVLTVREATRLDDFEMRAAKTAGPKETRAILAEVKKLLAEKKRLSKDETQFARDLCSIFEGKSADTGALAYAEVGGQLAKSADKADAATGRFMVGMGRRLQLPGREIEVKGTTLAGKEIDWKTYRGKVVLVDFWATWCAPCRGQIPHMKEMHEAYHERGFEIVGISIDSDRAALEKFLAKEKLPWICLHDGGTKGVQPMQEHYGVEYIPLPILVGRDGKVLSMGASGEELSRLLAKHLGPAKKKKS